MSTHPDRGDAEFTHNQPDVDPLGAIYSALVTPDIEEIDEHAERLAEDGEAGAGQK